MADSFANGLVTRRMKYIRMNGDDSENFSNIDTDVKLTNLKDIFYYIPRAVQIGLTAPFPNKWFTAGSSKTTSLFKLINILEMIIYYVSYIGIISILLKRKEMFVFASLMGYASVNLIAFTTAIPNIGTLHRIRYGFTMLIVCLGCAELFKLFLKYKRDTI